MAHIICTGCRLDIRTIAGVLTNLWDYRAEFLQAAILILIFFVSKIPVEPLRRQLDKVQMRVMRSSLPEILPVAKYVIPILMWALHPLIAWTLGMAILAGRIACMRVVAAGALRVGVPLAVGLAEFGDGAVLI